MFKTIFAYRVIKKQLQIDFVDFNFLETSAMTWLFSKCKFMVLKAEVLDSSKQISESNMIWQHVILSADGAYESFVENDRKLIDIPVL